MKPFLLLSTRAEDIAADGEYEALLKFGGLSADELVQIRVEQGPLPELDLSEYSGVFLGGGPFNASDEDKGDLQQRVEADLDEVLEEVMDLELPFLGLCYGIGTVTTHLGGQVDRTYAEPIGAADITLTHQGRDDPLLEDVPDTFRAFVGHKEAVSELPDNAVLLATGEACPVQMFRVGDNCYVTQFHPELDVPGISSRIQVYKNYGYFDPDETEALTQRTAAEKITPGVHKIIERFVDLYADFED